MPRRKITSPEEGEAYFDLWVRQGGRVLAAYARRMEAAGGPAAVLTYEPESLPEVFSWTVGRLRLVLGDVVGDGDLPAWLTAGPITAPGGGFDAESARWVDGLSRYYGEVLVRHLPGVRWVVADEPRYRHMYPDQWWPVVSGPRLVVNPLYVGRVAAKQCVLPPDERDRNWLLDNYRSYLAAVTKDRNLLREESEAWLVGEVDHEPTMAEGWRFGVSGDEDADLDEARAQELTERLRLLPGVSDVEREDRTSWLVAGTVSEASLEVLVRAWAQEQMPATSRRGGKKRKP